MVSRFVLALTLFVATPAFAGGPVCADLFAPKASVRIDASPQLARTLLSFETHLGAGSTTSLRREDKYVVSRETIDRELTRLSTEFGDAFVLRDKKEEGRKNMTVTQYATPIVFTVNGVRKSAKFRLRKYYSDAVAGGDMRAAGITDGRSFLELKIDHPEYDGVVVKPRLLISDADADALQNRTAFVLGARAMSARWKTENPKIPASVIDGFISALMSTYTRVGSSLPLFAKTAYVRDSYSLYISPSADAMTSGAVTSTKPIEIQFTIDREINVLDSRTGRTIAAYGPNDAVVEIKVPLAFAALKQTQQYAALGSVARIKAQLTADHNLAYARGAGKLSTFTRSVDFGD